jgi:hypothetical protein
MGGVTENVEISLEVLRKSDIGFKAASRGLFSSKRCLRIQVNGKHYTEVENVQVIAEEEFFHTFLQLEQYVFYITDIGGLA